MTHRPETIVAQRGAYTVRPTPDGRFSVWRKALLLAEGYATATAAARAMFAVLNAERRARA